MWRRRAALGQLILLLASVAAGQEPEDWALYGGVTGFADTRFGAAVAISGQQLLVGAPTDGYAAVTGGAVRAYRFDGDVWVPNGIIVPDPLDRGDTFGNAVALSGDLAVIGARGDDQFGFIAGAAFLSTCGVKGCSAPQRIVQPGLELGDQFGGAVDVDDTGTVIAIGALGDDDLPFGGAVYVYELNAAGHPVFRQKLLPMIGSGHQGLGVSVRCSDTWIVAGTVTDQVYAFRRAGLSWVLDEIIEDPMPSPYDLFGQALDIDGDTLLVGEPSLSSGFGSGAAFVYERAASWQLAQHLTPSDGFGSIWGGDDFGTGVALSEGRALIGAPQHNVNGNSSGQAYLFERDASGAWIETRRLGASDADASDHLGVAVGLDGAMAVAGAPFAEISNIVTGATYVYDLSLGASVRPGTIHSGGRSADLRLSGSSFAATSAITGDVGPAPAGSLGGLLAARSGGHRTIGAATLWLAHPIARLGPPGSVVDGWLRLEFDPAAVPLNPTTTVLAGEEWLFQAWFVDSGAGGGIGFSDAVRVTFD
jgi:hypothetical protein